MLNNNLQKCTNQKSVLDQRQTSLSSSLCNNACTNPYFMEKCRCLSSVSLFLCRKALGLLTSSPLPSFLLSEGTHLKNENKVIVPVLFLKSLQMLSADGRLIVRRAAAVRAAAKGRRSPVQVEERSKPPFGRSITEKTHTGLHSAGKWRTRASVPPLGARTWHWLGT